MSHFKLENHPKINPVFDVPDEPYFDRLSTIIFERTINQKTKVIPLFNKKYFWMRAMVAAVVVGCATSFWYQSSTNEYYAISDFVTTENSITVEEIAEQLTEDDLRSLEKTLIVHDQETLKQIENYL